MCIFYYIWVADVHILCFSCPVRCVKLRWLPVLLFYISDVILVASWVWVDFLVTTEILLLLWYDV